MTPTKIPVLQSAADAPARSVAGGSVAVRLRGEQTGNTLALIENVLPGGFGGMPLHVHPSFDEAFYVLEGRLTFRVGEAVMTAGPGALVFAPGAVPHTFAELTGDPVRVLLWTTPAGHERYFDAMADAMERGVELGPELFAPLWAEHGVTNVGSPNPLSAPDRPAELPAS
jgi:quercetin dioxygenase-like cupin family protein